MDCRSTIDTIAATHRRLVIVLPVAAAMCLIASTTSAQEAVGNRPNVAVEVEGSQLEQSNPLRDSNQTRVEEPSPEQKEVPVKPVSVPVVPVSANGDANPDVIDNAAPSQFDQDQAFRYLKEVCAIGPRPSASPGMRKQQIYLQNHFKNIGGSFLSQEFRVRSPYNGQWVQLHNIVVRWHPERKKRLLICCHHDTRPFADADRQNPRAKFIGANDGGSGVALLCELGHHMADLDGEYGVDFIFFDGEEFVIQRQRDPMFLGSTYFAREYAAGNVGWKYEQAVLVDMVADKDLQIFMEGNSLHFAQGLTHDVWAVAKRLGVNEFIPESKHKIRDDHIPLNEIAKIPTCDIIDFDYPNPQKGNSYWHTRQDKIQNCSADSLGKVGSVVLEWIRTKQRLE